ncbi:MAG: hypothetical protein HOE90_22870 [Bacteriovoracaceae bacterium]|jgi:hypothetical protein|nr:hypothetical protein [Bacteriovoracaceae bacterium]
MRLLVIFFAIMSILNPPLFAKSKSFARIKRGWAMARASRFEISTNTPIEGLVHTASGIFNTKHMGHHLVASMDVDQSNGNVSIPAHVITYEVDIPELLGTYGSYSVGREQVIVYADFPATTGFGIVPGANECFDSYTTFPVKTDLFIKTPLSFLLSAYIEEFTPPDDGNDYSNTPNRLVMSPLAPKAPLRNISWLDTTFCTVAKPDIGKLTYSLLFIYGPDPKGVYYTFEAEGEWSIEVRDWEGVAYFRHTKSVVTPGYNLLSISNTSPLTRRKIPITVTSGGYTAALGQAVPSLGSAPAHNLKIKLANGEIVDRHFPNLGTLAIAHWLRNLPSSGHTPNAKLPFTDSIGAFSWNEDLGALGDWTVGLSLNEADEITGSDWPLF